jgi:hypothetical protein
LALFAQSPEPKAQLVRRSLGEGGSLPISRPGFRFPAFHFSASMSKNPAGMNPAADPIFGFFVSAFRNQQSL